MYMNLGKTPIIIIGTGVAGLTIAKTLKPEDYIILEARDRIGGRVLHFFSLKTPIFINVYLSLCKNKVINE